MEPMPGVVGPLGSQVPCQITDIALKVRGFDADNNH
jgi:hypothetical protein